MRTAYDRTGKPHVFKQDIDAHDAIKAGMLFELPPKGMKVERKVLDKDDVTAQELVDYAKKEFDVDLDPLMRLEMLKGVIEDLENPKPLVEPKEKEKKTIRKRIKRTAVKK